MSTINDIYHVGDRVILGEHQTTDIYGKPCSRNWNSDMIKYVGKEAIIKSVDYGVDSSGSKCYRVNIDGEMYLWRGINMTSVNVAKISMPAKEAPCRQCSRNNDMGVKSCYLCGCPNPTSK